VTGTKTRVEPGDWAGETISQLVAICFQQCLSKVGSEAGASVLMHKCISQLRIEGDGKYKAA
jgi:hypothetical protein